jgi:hypothetical protein
LKGNPVNTIPYSCRSQIPKEAAADSRQDSGTGSRLFEVNIWIWKYGMPFPHKFSLEEAVAMRNKRVQPAAGIQGKRSCNSSALARGSSLKNGSARAMNVTVMDNGI